MTRQLERSPSADHDRAIRSSRRARAPLQARSRRTLDQLLDVTESLLAGHPPDEISVRDIVSRARASTGSFYARFEDKDACIGATLERLLHAGAIGAASGVAAPSFEQLMRSAVRTYRANRGLLRALVSYVRARPRSRVARLAERATTASHARVAAALLVRRDNVQMPRDGVRADFAISVAFRALRDGLILAGDADAWPDLSDRELADQLTAMILGYAGAAASRTP